ncbi:MAG: FUSC family protein [Novosphingobium sp.]
MTEAHARDLAFVLRCSCAATLSFLLAQAVGLPHPVWAAMSGVIVGQEKLGDTRQATIGRFIGTLLGVMLAVAIGTLSQWVRMDTAVEIAVAVALAAVAARRWPPIRVCMWTCPIVFLTATPGMPLWEVGLFRGAEVLLGGAVGATLHFFAEAAIAHIVSLNGSGPIRSRRMRDEPDSKGIKE